MENIVDIRPLPDAGVYQLILPEQVSSLLQLKQPDGKMIRIIHENKMQLEWLGQRIWQQYHFLDDVFITGKTKLIRKKRLAFIILIMAALISIFRTSIAGWIHVDIIYLTAFLFTVGVISCMQLMKYFALGTAGTNRDQVSGQISALKELIRKDYSSTD